MRLDKLEQPLSVVSNLRSRVKTRPVNKILHLSFLEILYLWLACKNTYRVKIVMTILREGAGR